MDSTDRPFGPITTHPVRPYYVPEPDWMNGLKTFAAGAMPTPEPSTVPRHRRRASGRAVPFSELIPEPPLTAGSRRAMKPAERRMGAAEYHYGDMGPGDEFSNIPQPPPAELNPAGVTVPTKPPLLDLNTIPPVVGPQGESFAMNVNNPQAAPMMIPPPSNGGALSAAGGHDQISGGAVNMPPAAQQAPSAPNPNKMAALQFLMEAGLGTMAAGGQPGTNTMGAIGQGVLGAIDRKTGRDVRQTESERAARSEARDDKRLGMEGRRVDLTEDRLKTEATRAERTQAETERHNKAIEDINRKKAEADDRKAVRDQMKEGVNRDQAILDLAQDKAKSETTSYSKDKWGIDTGTPALDPAGYQKNVTKHLDDLNKRFGTNIELPQGKNAGTMSDPIEPKSQADIDSAPSGTVFRVNGKLMVK